MANTFTSVVINGGPAENASGDAAIRLGAAGALGTAPVTFANTISISGFYFLTGFGTASTFANNVAFSGTAGITNRFLGTDGGGQVVTVSGVLSGGTATSTINLENTGSVGTAARLKVTNAANTVLSNWSVLRGGFEFTSDGALGNTGNDISLSVAATTSGNGLMFGANSISLAAGRAVTVASTSVVDTQAFTGSQINGGVTFTGQLVKRGTGDLTLNAAGTGSGGVSILEGPNSQTSAAISVGDNAALGTGVVAIGAGSLTALMNTGASRTVTNNISLPSTGTQTTRILATDGTTFALNGVISGGSATEELLIDATVAGGSTGTVKLGGSSNTFTVSQVRVARGGLTLVSDSSLGNSGNKLVLDVGTAIQVGLRLEAALSSSRSIQLGTGKQVVDTAGVDSTLTGVLSNYSGGTGDLWKTGDGTLALTNASTYTGATTVEQGTLEISGASGSLTATTSVTVSGGTLLLNQSTVGRIKDTALVSLGGAGTTSKIELKAGVTETLGALTLTTGSSTRVIDFGATGSVLTLASLASSTTGLALQIWNWSGTVFSGGGTDQLISTGVLGANIALSDITFYKGGAGSQLLGSAMFAGGGSSGELVPIPEAGGLATALLLLGSAGWRERRRLLRAR